MEGQTAARRWNIVEHPNWDEANRAAAAEAKATSAFQYTVILYGQANRMFAIGSLPFKVVASQVKLDSYQPGMDVDECYNRPLIPEHVRAIENYLLNNEDFILPPITLCVDDPLSIHVVASPSRIKEGTLVLPVTTRFQVSDGQHRIKGIKQVLERSHRFDQDAIGVTIVSVESITKAHQDFVDCAQTKSISPALLTAFNVRDPLARLVREIAEESQFFQGRIDKIGKSVGKNSVNLFTLNQLRTGVAELLCGGVASSEEQRRKDVAERVTGEKDFRYHKERMLEFYRKFTVDNRQWGDVALVNERPSVDPIDTRSLRERYIHFNGTGLVVMGRVGYCIHQQQDDDVQDELIARLAKLDWSRESSLWAGNLISSDGRLANNYPLVAAAVLNVKRAIGLAPLPEELRAEEMRAKRLREREEAAGDLVAS